MRIGAIADDFTGASDLGNMFTRSGLSTALCIGVPGSAVAETDAAVVALKTRSIPAEAAVARSLEALEWLRGQGCEQIYFKYCSTFDSTPEGNIGPVLEALADALGAARAVVVPAFPGTGRRVMMGHLFVGDQLLNRSGMESHPLTPMTEPDLRRWLARQTSRGVGHVDITALREGAEATRAALDAASAGGAAWIVMDTVDDADLMTIGAAVKGEALVSGGSGLGLGLAQNFDGLTGAASEDWAGRAGRAVALAGSCSRMTQAQVAAHDGPALHLDPHAIAAGDRTVAEVADWVREQPADSVPLVTSTMASEELAKVQEALGRDRSAEMMEAFFGDLAKALVSDGFERLIVGGGETSGAVVSALGLTVCRIGPQIAPGVPALAPDGAPFVCTLKSGNFGDEAFFATAARVLGGEA